MAGKVDEIALIKSMYTEAINHDPAITYICTGDQLPGKASLGAWLSYGLGTENENLPAFMVMTATWSGRQQAQALYNRLWGSGFLPTKYQGVALRSAGDKVLYLSNPAGIDASCATTHARFAGSIEHRRLRKESVIQKRKLALPSTKWRFGCKPVCRTGRHQRRTATCVRSVRS